ncbi:Hypp9689, partial [Branchiostoma lanceolatum]
RPCPKGWSGYYNHCYKFIRDKVQWSDANQSCKQLDANLASIASFGENEFIAHLVANGAMEDGAAPSGDDPPSYNDVLPSYDAVMAQGEEPLETWRLMGGRPSQVSWKPALDPPYPLLCQTPMWKFASSRRSDQPDGSVARLAWLSGAVWRGWGLSVRTLLISLFVGLCALLLVGLLPPSFAYYGLKKLRSTGVVNTKVVYGTGRYAIGPDFEFKLFPRGAHVMQLNNLAIFTSDLLEVVINCSFQHFLRKDEVGLLHDKFDLDYEPVLYRVAYSTIKETATLYSTVNFMSSRPEIEVAFHRALRDRLQGDCCTGDNDTQPASCRPPPDCDMGYHTDVRYFQLFSVTLPALIVERSMTALTLQIDAEKEQFIQKHEAEHPEPGRPDTGQRHARASLVLSRAYAQTNQTTEMSHVNGLQLMYNNLNISQEEENHRSHWIRALEKHPRLHRGISFQDY